MTAPMPGTLVLVAGTPASGKTTLSRLLAARLGIPLLGKDDVKELLYDAVGFQSRTQKVALGVAAFDMLCYAAAAILRTGGSVLLESNFESRDLPFLLALSREQNARIITVRLDGDMGVLYARFRDRELSPDRHPGHVFNDAYPREDSTRPAATLSQEAYTAGFAARGMHDFSLGRLISLDATSGASPESLAEEAYFRVREAMLA